MLWEEPEDPMMLDYEDTCRGCGAAYSHRYAAFTCGYPLADCPAMEETSIEIEIGGPPCYIETGLILSDVGRAAAPSVAPAPDFDEDDSDIPF